MNEDMLSDLKKKMDNAKVAFTTARDAARVAAHAACAAAYAAVHASDTACDTETAYDAYIAATDAAKVASDVVHNTYDAYIAAYDAYAAAVDTASTLPVPVATNTCILIDTVSADWKSTPDTLVENSNSAAGQAGKVSLPSTGIQQTKVANCHLWEAGKQCEFVTGWVCLDQCCAIPPISNRL